MEDILDNYNTYRGWKEQGRQVIKGERHRMRLDDLPVFHFSQTKPINHCPEYSDTEMDFGYESDIELGGIGYYQDEAGDFW